jgi:hypothetical protein
MHKAIEPLPPFANREVRTEYERYNKELKRLGDLDQQIHVYKERIRQLESHSMHVVGELRSYEKMVSARFANLDTLR